MKEFRSKRLRVWENISLTMRQFKVLLLGYRSYTALLTQTGTNPPVATVLENTLGLNPVFDYDGVGAYTIVDSSELFTNNKTYVLATGTGAAGISININDTTTIEIGCFNMAQPGGGNQNDMLLNAAFEIRVYN